MLLDILTLARRGVAALERGGERAWSADDLLTHGEVLRRLRAGKDNREARALLDRTERRHAPGDARWRWEDVARVAREIDAKHRGDGLMADDDTVDLIARALKDFPGLVQERDRLKAVLDAETGRKGRPGWEWLPNHGGGQWVLHVEGAHAFLNTPTRPGDGLGHPVVFVFNGVTTTMYRITDALQGMEYADGLLLPKG